MNELQKIVNALSNAVNSDDDLATKATKFGADIELSAEHQEELQKLVEIAVNVKESAPKLLEVAQSVFKLFEKKAPVSPDDEVTQPGTPVPTGPVNA